MLITGNPLAGLVLGALSAVHWVLIAVAVLILFGGRKIPELARGMARGLRIFKEEMHSTKKVLEDAIEEEPPEEPPKQLKREKAVPPPNQQANQREKDKENLG